MSKLRAVPTPGDLMRKHGHKPKKNFGQNFLHDPTVHQAILDELTPDRSIIEIGAGLGTLTSYMLNAGHRVHAIERDRDLCEVLRTEMADTENFTLSEADAVKFDYSATSADMPTIVGNLPYHLTAPLLFRLFEFHLVTGPWIVMIQKEVGQRLCAEPGGKTYGGITAILGRLRSISLVKKVPPGSFLPAPKVDSVIIRLDARAEPAGEVKDPEGYREVIHAAFQGRRKTLLNSLSKLAPKEDVHEWMAKAGVDPKLRAERLSSYDFAAIQRARETAQPKKPTDDV